MNVMLLSKVLFFFCSFSFQRVLSQNPTNANHAAVPPRGWNSYDSFCWIVSEQEFLQNAELVAKRLRAHGYEYVVVDYLWYRRLVPHADIDTPEFDGIDEWGRLVPDPMRWPSSVGGKGFSEVAKKVHDMGLKFGIHVMNGLSRKAFNSSTPILDIATGKAYEESGRKWYSKDVGIQERPCKWMKNSFMSVDTKLGAGRAFLRSLYKQFADWNVDFVKLDCVFGDDLDADEISFVSDVLKGLNRPLIFSLSPGTNVTVSMGKHIAPLANMYRITGDDWDKWQHLLTHFNPSRDFAAAKMIGANGLLGKSWPDLDMLPFGWITEEGSTKGPFRMSNLTRDEQKTQMTLWSMAKSALMFGGDMRKLDKTTFRLITNPTLMEINSFSSNNMEFPFVTGTNDLQFTKRTLKGSDNPGGTRSWIATGRRGEIYLAYFNLNSKNTVVSATLSNVLKALPGTNFTSCSGREIWSGQKYGHIQTTQVLSISVAPHGCALFVLACR